MTTLFLNDRPQPREIKERVNLLIQGRVNSTGSITLDANTTTTALDNSLIHEESFIALYPTTANAQADAPYISTRADGSATITHNNTADTDKTFMYAILG